METFVVLSEKNWHQELFLNLKSSFPQYRWILITTKEQFCKENLEQIRPSKVFIPHWSHIIPSGIFEKFECIVFHMTDLPFGRGGSPLQNLIVRGLKETKISALKVQEGIDSGPIYLKYPLPLFGTAQEILLRASITIQGMIGKIITENPVPKQQEGTITKFTRRKPSESDISQLEELEDVYDYIRMLDAEGYPQAFVELENYRLEFSRVKRESNKILLADVRIIKK
ncbi:MULTISPECIES: formyltransferase family protein [Sphingobacterium]|uniref:formyltransferase family protein n=1 Tax=Sphingobacterium TaxID=28453 RepID=UPI00257A96E4|nr:MULTISPECIES: formyltransferase family protein [Sphingobacterium]